MYSVMNNASVPQLMDVYLSGTPNDVTACKRLM
jgi:protein involved in ribonucleotide reduction